MSEKTPNIGKDKDLTEVKTPEGYVEKDAKTKGTVTRGNGCATKGITARGPMG